MKSLFIVLFLFIAAAAAASGFDFMAYSRLTNQAELMIIDGKFDKALHVYDAAFAVKEVPFAKDLYNASVCAVKAKQQKRALTLCRRLAEKGLGGDFFAAKRAYRDLFKRPEWHGIITRAAYVRDSIRTSCRDVLHAIDSLVAKDQYYNGVWRQSGMKEKEQQEMYLAGDTISRQLIALFDRYGFLSEDIIGATLNPNGTLSNMLPFDVIIIHNYQREVTGDTLFSKALRQALYNGQINADYYASILDAGSNMGGRPYYGALRYYFQYKCSIYLDRYKKERAEQVEQNRASIGLCNTQDMLRKVIYRTVHGDSDFKITVDLTMIGSYADKESEKIGLQQSVLVFDHIPGCKEN